MVEKVKLTCPFCGKECVDVVFTPSFFQAHTSRSSASGSKTSFYKTKEKHEVQSGCSNCHKSAKEIQKAFEGGKKDPEKDKKIFERLKKQGLDFTTIKTKF